MKRRLQHRSAVAGLALALALGMAGCSENEAPAGSPVPSDSSSATAGASVPALPDEARGRGPEAAEAFVRHYVDLINYATSTLQTEPLLRASSGGCEGCRSVVDLYDGVRRDGGRVRGGQWTIERLESAGDQTGPARAYVRVSYPRQTVRYKAGSQVKTFPPGEALFVFEYQRGDSGFVVTRFQGPVQ